MVSTDKPAPSVLRDVWGKSQLLSGCPFREKIYGTKFLGFSIGHKDFLSVVSRDTVTKYLEYTNKLYR